MKKLKRFQLNEANMLSNQEMQDVTGGTIIIEACHSGTVNSTCIVDSKDGNWIQLGYCVADPIFENNELSYQYICVAKNS